MSFSFLILIFDPGVYLPNLNGLRFKIEYDSTDYELTLLDFNQDGLYNILDIVQMINYILDI